MGDNGDPGAVGTPGHPGPVGPPGDDYAGPVFYRTKDVTFNLKKIERVSQKYIFIFPEPDHRYIVSMQLCTT